MPATLDRPRERTRRAVRRRHDMIRDLRHRCGYTVAALMAEFGVTERQILRICKEDS